MRILFMGTPDFAVASLRRLVADGHEVCGVFTQPDKPKNRGHKLVPTPVKEFALTENIPVYQPLKMRDGTALELVQSLAPELTVVAAYGRILPEDILEAPRYGSINVHSSLLPKYRGRLKQDSMLCTHTISNHDGNRSCKSKCTRTADNQNGNRSCKRISYRSSYEHPDHKCHDCNADNDWYKYAGYFICDLRNRRFRCRCITYHMNDL